MSHTVSRVAALANISIRTLHHYDEIGLVRPSARSEAGYRLYTIGDLQRLQQVLFFRELEFPLEEIKRVLDDPNFDMKAALELQAAQLTARMERTRMILATVQKTLSALEKGEAVSAEVMFENFDQSQYEGEVQERWGETESYRISRARTSQYTPAQWETLKAEAGALYVKLGLALKSGVPAHALAVMALAEAHRQHIETWFYPCSHAMHRALGDGYVSDPRFTRNIDKYQTGLSQFLRDAIHANADRHNRS